MSSEPPIIINGWTLFAHPLFLSQVETLVTQVEQLRQKAPQGYKRKNVTKRLAAIARLAFEMIPEDPTRPNYRQGATLGPEYKHWFRAKFFQQYRLFFRYHQESKIIVLAWVNDEQSKRASARETDAYRVFAKMLDRGHPPDDWETLMQQVSQTTERLKKNLDTEI